MGLRVSRWLPDEPTRDPDLHLHHSRNPLLRSPPLIAYRIQHVAGRHEPLHRLRAQMPYAQVVTDDGGKPLSPLRGYKRCLEAIPASVSHLVVVQDDVVVASSFRERVEKIAAERPGEIVILCVCGVRNRTCKWFLKALWAGESYTRIAPGDYHHVIGVLWPKEKAEAFMEWLPTAKLPGRPPHVSDDAAFGTWVNQTQQPVVACVPSIVQHPDDFKSVMRISGQGGTTRRAIAFPG